MGKMMIWRRTARAAAGLGLALLLAACMLSPGKFASALDLRKDGTFTYSYEGEIYILGLGQLADIANELDGGGEFTPSFCYDEDEGWVERECTEAELEQQRSDWAARQEARRAEDERNAKAFSTVFGGIDPSDPEAAEEIAQKLQRQHGWNSVTYKGGGVYDVDFSVTGRLGHDFTFPVLEGFPMANFFVVANLRDGNAVRIEAPGFAVQSNSSGTGNGMLQMASIFGAGETANETAKVPTLSGTFTVTTDAAILANNTDEGPEAVPNGQKLNWTVSKRTTAAPMALIRLGS